MDTNTLARKSEADPDGLNPHAPGAKLDKGKPRPGLVLGDFARALQHVTNVGTYGAQKYTDRGWRSVSNGVSRYGDALWRHLLKDAEGEVNDPDTGIPHLAHAAWNALAILELRATQPQAAVRNPLANAVADPQFNAHRASGIFGPGREFL